MRGNIVAWEIRGMGFSDKHKQYQVRESEINSFFVCGLAKVIEYFKHQKIVLLCHSLSAYICMRYLIEHPG